MRLSTPGSLRASVPAGYARALVRKFGRTAEQRAALLQSAGLTEPGLNAPGAETSVVALIALAGALTRQRGESWPLEAATVWSAALQGALDVALRSAATLDAAMAVAARYGHVRAPYLNVRLRSDKRTRRIVYEPSYELGDAEWRAVALAVALATHALYGQIMEEGIAEATIEFPWPAPGYVGRMREFFACKLRFGAREFAFEIPARLGSLGSPFADPTLHAKAIAELDDAARRIAGEEAIVGALERLILAHLPQRLGEAEAARRLGLSRRTLVRRLSLANVAFRSVLEGVLRERAGSLMAGGSLSREEMAAALGYADPTSFSRACRRWFGPRGGAPTHLA